MLEDQVNVFIILSAVHVVKANDVLVVQLVEEHDLPESALGISRILKGIEDLLQGHRHVLGPFVQRFPNHPVGAFANAPNDLITLQDVWLDILRHF
jgi:hypothetical protein